MCVGGGGCLQGYGTHGTQGKNILGLRKPYFEMSRGRAKNKEREAGIKVI